MNETNKKGAIDAPRRATGVGGFTAFEGWCLKDFRRDIKHTKSHSLWLDGLRRRDWNEKRAALSWLAGVTGFAGVPVVEAMADPATIEVLTGAFSHMRPRDRVAMQAALNRIFWCVRFRGRASVVDGGIKIANGRVPVLQSPPSWVRGAALRLADAGLSVRDIKGRLWLTEARIRGDLGILPDLSPAEGETLTQGECIATKGPWACANLGILVKPTSVAEAPGGQMTLDESSLREIMRQVQALAGEAIRLIDGGRHDLTE